MCCTLGPADGVPDSGMQILVPRFDCNDAARTQVHANKRLFVDAAFGPVEVFEDPIVSEYIQLFRRKQNREEPVVFFVALVVRVTRRAFPGHPGGAGSRSIAVYLSN